MRVCVCVCVCVCVSYARSIKISAIADNSIGRVKLLSCSVFGISSLILVAENLRLIIPSAPVKSLVG